ncbi:hypothetical protein JAAARDRAFT_141347, partial [Jaapia argillacea MUCL 33604]
KWLTSVGLSSKPDKVELMHHSWMKDQGYSPSTTLPGPNGTHITKSANSTMRWLGVLFDRKLSFNQHVRHLADCAMTSVNGGCMLANTIRGLSQAQL